MKNLEAVIIALGGVVSLVFMYLVGRHQRSVVLMALFTIWVGSPFAAFLYGHSKRAAFAWLGLIVSLVSTAIYGAVALGPPLAQPAKFFLLVPLVSWAVIGISMLVLRKHD